MIDITGGIRLKVRVQARASHDEVVGVQDGRLRLRLSAPPLAGAANEACRVLLAELCQVAKSQVRLVTGTRAREKIFEIQGDTAALHAKLLAHL
ncbi:MAG: DUF167 domain-containing protein [Cyanobacteria bacterium NC_groundwater_1444_Ag_S-0.65um_54_12]|nr:DUF167 domain-containing protein [Cyanobacteria bacterium NC_groundwater_1444_Ag_S-0.65um_54_12]